MPISKRSHRTVRTPQNTEIKLIGMPHEPLSDLYHALLTMSWGVFFSLTILCYLTVNFLFAIAYAFDPVGIKNANPGSFVDLFFFSVQTMATIGYGAMYPQSVYTNSLVALEALIGLLGVAMATSLMFARFARPTARVLFSRDAVVTTTNGIPTLMFRAANQRGNQIIEAQIRATLLRSERNQEGVEMRRFYDLKLVRSHSPVFTLSWVVMHIIDQHSPLYGYTAESWMQENQPAIIVTLTGLDETFAQTIHARHAYSMEQILWNHRFVDILSQLPNGKWVLDYHNFHQTLPT